MNKRAFTFLLYLLCCLTFSSYSQSVTPQPVFTIFINGREAADVIYRSDSVFTITCSDGKDYAIGRMTMSVANVRSKSIGGNLTDDITSFIGQCKTGDVINVTLVLYAVRSPTVMIAGSYTLQD